HLFGRHAQHVIHREGRQPEDDVDAGVGGVTDGFGGLLDVTRYGAREAGQHDVDVLVAGDARQVFDGREVQIAGTGVPDLDALHAQLQELAEHLFFFFDVPRVAQGLVAVAQGDVVEERPTAVGGVDGDDDGFGAVLF